VALLLLLGVVAAGGIWRATSRTDGGGNRSDDRAGAAEPTPTDDAGERPGAEEDPKGEPTGPKGPQPINEGVAGLTTFRGNASRTYHGRGPVPKDPVVLWRYPSSGAMCSISDDGSGPREWCGSGWTGQPNVVEVEGRTEVRFGAYDRAIHILDAGTGAELYPPFPTGDIIKGTVTSDPDGFPLLYSGSRDNLFRVMALDRPAVTQLWALDAASAPQPLWNNDWDGSALVIDDYLLEGGENSWFYVVKLNRGYSDDGLVTVDPVVRIMIPGFDDQLLADLGTTEVSIENSVAFRDGIVYFANSGGLVQGWDISKVLKGGKRYSRVFRYWVGEDVDASIVIDDEGYLYVAAELERFSARGLEVGQLMKLDPRSPDAPLVWSLPVPGRPEVEVDGGIWATPALHRRALYVTTNTGRLLGVDRNTGAIAWELELTEPTWSSPVVVDRTLIVGDCAGMVHAYDVRKPLAGPPQELWSVALPGCVESTPAVWKGRIYVGARDGGFYAIGDP
jgi:outer membrane protein assembly factor BamB